MAGNTVLRLSPGAAAERYLPSAQELKDETERLVGLFTPEVLAGYGAAVAIASGEMKPFLSDRHFFLGLIAMSPELPILSRNGGPLPPRFLAETLRRNEYWRGTQAWIGKQLRSLTIEVSSLFRSDLLATPRLL